MIPVERMRPNRYNPNQMSKSKFAEYVAEVRYLGRPPKPTIVRPVGDDIYEIVDGEHAWRAAQQICLTEILCEVRDLDDFQARRETYKRNRGGKDSPVLLGRMFCAMMQERRLSCRKLAKEIDVPEATIRHHINYAKAADRRRRFVNGNCDREVAELNSHQVTIYLRLPEPMADAWLDAGADIADLTRYYEHDVSELTDPLRDADLFWLVEGDFVSFSKSLEYALNLADWHHRHEQLENLKAYVHPMAELRLPTGVLDHLPCRVRDDGKSVQAVISPERWQTIVQDADQRTSDFAGLLAVLDSHIRVALREAGVDLSGVLGPAAAEMLQLLAEAPASIRDAEFLTLFERYELFTVPVDGVPEEQVEAAQDATLHHLRQRRMSTSDTPKVRNGCAPRGHSVTDVFFGALAEIQLQAAQVEEDEVFSDDEILIQDIVEHLCECRSVRDAAVEGRPATEVLATQLQALERSMLHLVATYVRAGSAEVAEQACRRWLLAVNQADAS
jgi:hypothetical protein